MRTRGYLISGGVVVALTAGSVSAVAATRAGSTTGSPMAARAATSCAVPSLPGSRVTVMLGDMGGSSASRGGMMGRAGMMSGTTGMMSGWMMLHAVPQQVAAGKVSIAVYNHGTRTHELVVLPLASDATVGSRTIASDNTVSEQGSLGEASNNCAAGTGDGIKAGAAGWVTLTLKPGRYELICNLPGHYAAGMYTELDVT